jgi:hypothetical protein
VSIQTRFGGVGLPSTVKDLEELITDSSNVVAVKVNLRLTTFLTVGNTGVGIVPIDVVMNSVAHLLFDLTHVWCRLVDFYTIQEKGALTTPCVPLVQLVVDLHDLFIQFQGNLTGRLNLSNGVDDSLRIKDLNLIDIGVIKDLTRSILNLRPKFIKH